MIAEAEVKQGAKDPQNLVTMFEAQARQRADRAAVRFKKGGAWQDVAWSELARRARRVADGLASHGLAPGDRVAIIGETNVEWILADLGILGAGGITVTIYQSNRPSECQFILADSGARLIFCDSAAQVAKIREVRHQLPALQGIVRASGPAAERRCPADCVSVVPAIACASPSLGRKTSTSGRRSETPCHALSGSQFVSIEVVMPASRHRCSHPVHDARSRELTSASRCCLTARECCPGKLAAAEQGVDRGRGGDGVFGPRIIRHHYAPIPCIGRGVIPGAELRVSHRHGLL